MRWLSALGVALGLAWIACNSGPSRAEDVIEPAADSGAAAELFARHCAVCHGATGRGDSEVARRLLPPPRDFATAVFRLVSTENGIPTDEDLVRTLRRGIPGSAMPSFAWLDDGELAGLARYVRALAVAGLAPQIGAAAAASGEKLDRHAALAQARSRLEPGVEVETGLPVRPSADAMARGRTLYVRYCAECHGEDGTGGPERSPVGGASGHEAPRDFTAGILAGGSRHRDLARRIRAGMPGTSMAATELGTDELGPLVTYVQSLLRADTGDRLVQRREQVVADRAGPGRLPVEPGDPQWSAAVEVEIVLAPLRWSDGAVVRAAVSAMHDGRDLAIRLRWRDQSRNDAIGSAAHLDAAAVQLSAADRPPLMGMGSADRPTSIWHWRPVWPEEEAALVDRANPVAHGWRSDAVERLRRAHGRAVQVEGSGSASRFASEATPLEAHARWEAGEWSVVFRRSLAARTPGEPALTPGEAMQLSVAIWNGAVATHDSDKSFSIWHALELWR